MNRTDIKEGKILMRKSDFLIADMYNAKSVLLQIQEQMANCDDYTEEEIRMLIRFIESKKEQCDETHTMAACQVESTGKYQYIYRSVYNSLADAFHDSYQLACALIRELNIRRERLRKTE